MAGLLRRIAPTLFAMEGPSIPAGEVERATRDRFVDLFIRVRVYVAPFVAVVALLAALEGPLWRTTSLIGAMMMVLLLSIAEHRHYLRTGALALGVPANLFALMVAQAVVVTGTGGLISPLMPGVIVFTVVAGLFGPPTFSRWVPLLFHIPWLFALAWIHVHDLLAGFVPQYLEGWVVLGRGQGPWVVAAVLGVMAFGGPQGGRKLRLVITRAYNDLSAAREREFELHRTQRSELEALTGELAHDLKNPLASMVGLGALLERELGDGGSREKARDHVRILRTEVDRMRKVVAELLDFSRPVSPVDRKTHDLEVLLREIVALYEGACAERGLSIELTCRGATEAAVDKRKIRTVLVNLVQNALEASPRRGTVAIEVTGTRDRVRIAVRDSGPGIDPAIGERVLEPGVTTKAEGSGLGLTIARTLVHQHDGTLELESDHGLTVTVELPRREIG
ncbi:MAG: HAMP domain-containing histidine kinase [Deltaproteobacteria bacterium]|nr:HAMP domain-containing histidine kinase [Deltaproteobacteria bacterium]